MWECRSFMHISHCYRVEELKGSGGKGREGEERRGSCVS